jgi:hypothetical protein
METMEVFCSYCGKRFVADRRYAFGQDPVYCSDDCEASDGINPENEIPAEAYEPLDEEMA